MFYVRDQILWICVIFTGSILHIGLSFRVETQRRPQAADLEASPYARFTSAALGSVKTLAHFLLVDGSTDEISFASPRGYRAAPRHAPNGLSMSMDGGEEDDLDWLLGPSKDAAKKVKVKLGDFDIGQGGSPVELEIQQGGKELQPGGMVWEVGLALAHAFLQKQINVSNQRILEVGSGTGVAGLAAAAVGGDVLMTDLDPFVPLLEENIRLNKLGERARALALPWGDERVVQLAEKEEPFDWIIGSDILYLVDTYELLLDTLVKLATPNRTEVLIVHPSRLSLKSSDRSLEGKFFEMAEEFFEIDEPFSWVFYPDGNRRLGRDIFGVQMRPREKSGDTHA